MSRLLRLTIGLVGLAFVGLVSSLPPAPLAPEQGAGDDSVPGVLHVHTNRSDGSSTPEGIASVAARAGLKFVVLTDHGDATRTPDAPAYVNGVLVIDAVEISTDAGHLVALNLPKAPYPLAGEARDVVEDIHRLGGFAIAAHPDSPKHDLAWQDWTVALDGVELINLDTAWRVRAAGGWRAKASLARAAMTYLIRPAASIGTLTNDSPELMARWTEMTKARHLVVFGGADAHARLELQPRAPGDNRFTVPLPSYEAVFRAMSTRVRPASALTGDAARDAGLVLDAARAGHAYLAFDALLTPPAFSFEAVHAGGVSSQGDTVSTDGPVTLKVKTNAPLAFKATLFRDDQPVEEASGAIEPQWQVTAEPAMYRVEIRATDRQPNTLWVMSNPIYVNLPRVPVDAPAAGAPVTLSKGPGATAAAASTTASASARANGRALFGAKVDGPWTTEAAADSKAAVSIVDRADGDRELLFRYGFPGGQVFGQYAAAVVSTAGGIQPHSSLSFIARAEKPVRLSVQLRQEGSNGQGWRWQRTVYVDDVERRYSIPLDDFRSMGPTLTPRAPSEHVSSVLLAVDQTNTAPGTSGRIWFRSVTLLPSAAAR